MDTEALPPGTKVRDIDSIKSSLPVYRVFGKDYRMQDVTVEQISGLAKYENILSKGAFGPQGKVSKEFQECVKELVSMSFLDFPIDKLFNPAEGLGVRSLMTLVGNIMDDLLGETAKNS